MIAELRKALDDELTQSMEPVAEIVECQIMGQQTVREIEGRWRFLKYGDKLYPQRVDQLCHHNKLENG